MTDSEAKRPAQNLPNAMKFAASFGVGDDSGNIHPVDICGVTLAAVQGLHEQVLELDSEISDLRRELAEVRSDLAGAKPARGLTS
ncbi:MAG: hypothetical protein HQ559_18040 [Lentisphaerae bacterium]|nr:hypothetical protein [Lentisphaerota bacterium]